MKKLLLASLMLAGFATKAQVVNDSVTLGASYADQVWYSLLNDDQGKQARNNWDLAFNLKDISTPIFVNTTFSYTGSTGVTLWGYPKDDTSAWASIDTTGLSTWEPRTNSDSSWAIGAMGKYADIANPFDLDWGVYDGGTHFVVGDSLYIIKLGNSTYKKLWMKHLKSGTFTFTFANLDGTDETTATIKKTDYADRNFAYYSIQNKAALNREPKNTDWDLTFVNYTTDYPVGGGAFMPYNVTGVLSNRGVRVAKATKVPNKATYTNYSAHTFQTAINAIGYDFKTTNPPLTAKDSTVYFVEAVDETIWKIIFNGTVTSADGIIRFSKEVMTTTSVKNTAGATVAQLSLYPNPSNASQATNIVYSIETANKSAKLSIYDMTGRVVYNVALETNIGLHTMQLPANTLTAGMYIVNLQTENGAVQQRLSVK